MPAVVNPNKRPPRPAVAMAAADSTINLTTMGPQSQRRLTLKDRTHQLQASSLRQPTKKLKAGDQQTLFSGRAFDPNQDCAKCKAKLRGRDIHRGHHHLCWNNRRTKGVVSVAALASIEEEKRLRQHFAASLAKKDKFSWQHTTKEAQEAFFAPRPLVQKGNKTIIHTMMSGKKSTTTATTTTTAAIIGTPPSSCISATDLCEAVTSKVNVASFVEEHKGSRAPLAMLALAGVVVEKIICDRRVDTFEYFTGLALTVLSTKEGQMHPQYHSIVGQKLLYVNWKEMFGLEVNCPRCPTGIFANDRTNFSKNKILFPIFDLEGPPHWCMIMSMKCSCCRLRTYSNTDQVLCQLAACARASYPVETKYALAERNSHIGTLATQMFDLLMTTYGNGKLCSRLLCNAINRLYLERVENYYSYAKANQQASIVPYLGKKGEYIKAYPPLGDGI